MSGVAFSVGRFAVAVVVAGGGTLVVGVAVWGVCEVVAALWRRVARFAGR